MTTMSIKADERIFNEFGAVGDRLKSSLRSLSTIVQNDIVSTQDEVEDWGRRMAEVIDETARDLTRLADMTWNHVNGQSS